MDKNIKFSLYGNLDNNFKYIWKNLTFQVKKLVKNNIKNLKIKNNGHIGFQIYFKFLKYL